MNESSSVSGSTSGRGEDGHRWADLDPLIKFGVLLAAFLFTGVVVEGALLVPYALITHGWTPGR